MKVGRHAEVRSQSLKPWRNAAVPAACRGQRLLVGTSRFVESFSILPCQCRLLHRRFHDQAGAKRAVTLPRKAEESPISCFSRSLFAQQGEISGSFGRYLSFRLCVERGISLDQNRRLPEGQDRQPRNYNHGSRASPMVGLCRDTNCEFHSNIPSSYCN
jgi:hypothetical protein